MKNPNAMTIGELAQKLNTTVPEIYKHYEKKFVKVPHEDDYVLSIDLIRKAIPNYMSEERESESLINDKRSDEQNKAQAVDIGSKLEEKEREYQEHLLKLKSFYNKSDKELVKFVQNRNSVEDLLLEGEYEKVNEKNFGFFKNILHRDGSRIFYPISNERIKEVFIANGSLTNGKRYLFEAIMARRKDRLSKGNPFLLQANNEKIHEVIELNVLQEALNISQKKLEEVNCQLQNARLEFDKERKAFEEETEKLFNEKEKKANEIIENKNQTINQKIKEIESKESELAALYMSIEESNHNLLRMENMISTLKNRVTLCRNLQFITKEVEERYINLLSAEEFEPEDHLSFEKDFEKKFYQLADHIHSYLFKKKNLIYTSYQVRNFLTLLKTHDLIVLSGLSGSGKTQIVKAFAEALGGIAKIIPVKPNWTSTDDLIGYYNPIQMSFLPTPFTEAIVEAIHNPNQLYFICLDEMNLARAEYYFADFLSKLEERNNEPEIELYANHEEELFVSEFNTLLNLIESSIRGIEINSWQDFLDNQEARNRFFEMLGNSDKESVLQLHAKMKRRLIDILKFPSTIKIPNNVRFIGAINVDETTHYFSPKILDRVHIVRFENPLLFEAQVNNWFQSYHNDKELKPVYVHPSQLSSRTEFPNVNEPEFSFITEKLKVINKDFLLPLNIDFGIRSIRQSLNYSLHNKESYNYSESYDISLNSVILQKILPRFIFDGSETAKNNKTKIEVAEELQMFLANELSEYYEKYDTNEITIGRSCSEHLREMIEQAKRNNYQVNFFA